MRVLVIPIILVALSSGCNVPNDAAVRFLNAHTLLPTAAGGVCTASTIGIYRGSLDLSGNTNYILQYDVESNYQSIVTTVPPDTVANQSRNEFVSKRIVFNYTSTPSLPFQTEQLDIYWVVQPNTTTGNWLQLYLLAPQARQLLIDSVQVGQPVEVLVQFQVFGELASGQKTNTNKVSYPITVYRSGFTTCRVAGDVRAPTGPCASPGGQDGSLVACCRDITPAMQGCPP
jgi:hypothetical protein